MKVLSFQYAGRFGLFLRAEVSVVWLTYPLPPRTSLIGLLGAILGMDKDTPQKHLADAKLGIAGQHPATHWHTAQLHKDIPKLPYTIKTKQKGSFQETTPTIMTQEWLIAPSYTVYASLPEPWHTQLRDRLERGALHYSPCMGLSEMLAEITYLGEEDAEALPYGAYEIESAVCLEQATLRAKEALERELFLQTLPMPHHVTEDRIFSLKNYLLERDGKPLPVETQCAYQLSQKVISFL